MVLGPRDEKEATAGDGRTPSTVLWLYLNLTAVTELLDDAYLLVTLAPSA